MSFSGILRFRQTTPERLVEEARSLGPRLRGKRAAEKALEVAVQYEQGIEGRRRWRAWRELIGVHEQCEGQLRTLKRVKNLLKEVEKTGLGAGQRSELFNALDRLVKTDADADLLEELGRRERSWLRVREQVKKVAPDVFVTHAFLMLADLSGVEVASLVVGALVGLGAIYTWAFYEAAIGMSVLTYFTWEDFTYQGLRVLLEIAIAVLLVESAFWVCRGIRRRSSLNGAFAAHRWVLRHPVMMVAGVVGFTALLTFCSGWLFGRLDRATFFGKERCDFESATVLDGSILRNVYLVGTTSRTATFLQVRDREGSESPEARALTDCEEDVSQPTGVRLPDFVAAVRTVLRHPIRDPLEEQAGFAERVLIMDRALVVCHARGDACLKQGRRVPDPSAREAIVDLARRLDGVARSDELVELKTDVDRHLNRHHDQIRALLRAP